MSDKLEDPVLYVRGLNKPSNELEDVWDDTILNNAYDKALKMANEEVAKRIAMETNSTKKENSKVRSKSKLKPNKNEQPMKPVANKKSEWKAGMPCRAVYEEDGLEYEAFLIKIIDEEDCIVKFLGYDNTEHVPISSLSETLGNAERMRQVEAALEERDDDGFESQPASEGLAGHSDPATPEPQVRSSSKKKKSSKKKNRSPSREYGELPALPIPSLNMFRHMIDMPMPMPPPPLASLSDRSDAEDQAISDMLLSWYMTGYYTGLYQGLKRQRQSRRHH